MISLRKIFGERTDPLREEKEASTLRERLRLAAEAKSREGLEKERRRVDEAKRAQMPRDEELREKKREKEKPEARKTEPLKADKKVQLDFGAGKVDLTVEAHEPPKKKLEFEPRTLKQTIGHTKEVVMEASLAGAGWLKNLLTRWGTNMANSKCAGGLGELKARTLGVAHKISERVQSIRTGTQEPNGLLGNNGLAPETL